MKKFSIILCILLVMSVCGFCIYYQIENHDKNNVKNPETQKIEEKIDTNSDIVTISMNKFSILNDTFVAGNMFGYLYRKNNYTVDNIDNDVKLMLGTEQLYLKDDNFKYGNFPVVKTKSEMQNEIQKIFGNDVTYSDSNINLNCKTLGTYDNTNQTYTFTESDGCGGTLTPYIETKIIEAIKYDDKLEIIEKMAYVDYTEKDNELITNVHKNENDLNVIGNLKENDDIFTLYNDKLDSYKYTFKYKNGNYYFESIKKMN